MSGFRCSAARRHQLIPSEVSDGRERATIHECALCGRWFARTWAEARRAGRIMGVEVRRCARPRGLE